MSTKHKNIGQSLDDFLKEEGTNPPESKARTQGPEQKQNHCGIILLIP